MKTLLFVLVLVAYPFSAHCEDWVVSLNQLQLVDGKIVISGGDFSGDLRSLGKLQIEGVATFNGVSNFNAVVHFNNEILMSNAGFWSDKYFGLYNGYDDGIRFIVYPEGPYGKGNNNIIVTTSANWNKDHDHDQLSPNPTFFVHSSTDPDIDNTQWVSLAHDTKDAVIENGKDGGTVRLDIVQGDLPATCTLNQIGFDTAGATKEWCFCRATDTWACSPASDGPAD